MQLSKRKHNVMHMEHQNSIIIPKWPWHTLHKTTPSCFSDQPLSFFVLAELTNSPVRENKWFSISFQDSNGECDSPLAYTTQTFVVLKALLSYPLSFCHSSHSVFLSPFSSPSCLVSRVDECPLPFGCYFGLHVNKIWVTTPSKNVDTITETSY